MHESDSNGNERADANGPVDHVVAFSTADEQIVVYDKQQLTAWSQSTSAVPITDAT